MARDTAASVPTPELDKRSDIMHSLRHPHEVLSEFYDWLQEQGLHLAKFEAREVEEPCPGFPIMDTDHECRIGRVWEKRTVEPGKPREWVDTLERHSRCTGTGWIKVSREDWWPDNRRPEDLFEDFFGLDSDEMERERVALLDNLRSGS